jgi:leucyl-tRNA synthetase
MEEKENKKYDHKQIESKWQNEWQKNEIYKTLDNQEGKENFYTLVEFPYPSGNLHIGHWYAFAVPDIFARAKRMQDYNVLFPIGFDSFGLPAENAAIKRGLDPKKWTYENIEYMEKQIASMGNSFDWSRKVITSDPEYYRWTQWLFLELFKKGLAYKKKALVNWCPSCQTVLANEQVVNGKCERCDSGVVQKDLEQWFFKITDYAERLLADMDNLDWPEPIKEAQRNWIGKSVGTSFKFQIPNSKLQTPNNPSTSLGYTGRANLKLEIQNSKNAENIQQSSASIQRSSATSVEVFTTRADTLFGATYLVLAPEHKEIENLKLKIENWDEVQDYINGAKRKTEIERTDAKKEKTGVQLDGVTAINPATGEEIPVWVADYVLGNYGTGAVMAVPAHDERDFEFAKKYNLPIRQVIEPKFVGLTGDGAVKPDMDFVKREAVCAVARNPKDDSYLCVSWKNFVMNGLVTGGIEGGEDPVDCARREIREETGYKNLKFVRKSNIAINTFFYHRVKEQNRHAHFQFVFFDLENEERDLVDEKESALHEIVWKKKDELKDFFTVFEGDFIVNILDDDKFVYTDEGIVSNSKEFDGMESESARDKIAEKFGLNLSEGEIDRTQGVLGQKEIKYKLRDWLLSRQRYWGCPIPVVYDPEGNPHPVKEENLPWLLPEDNIDFTPKGTSPLASSKELKERVEKLYGKGWTPEFDTMDTFVDSSWYFIAYCIRENLKSQIPISKQFQNSEIQNKLKSWMPVSRYSGGAEHTTMHLLYSRFFHKALFDLGFVNEPEPFKVRMNRGLILGPDGQKMSKSKGNVVDPGEWIEKVGADTVRMYLAFIGPYNEGGQYPWDLGGIAGMRRFLERVWKFGTRNELRSTSNEEEKNTKKLAVSDSRLETLLHKTIKKVTEDIESYKFNTAISSLMILLNQFESEKLQVGKLEFEVFLRLLAPFAPHITEEIWKNLGNENSIHLEKWPKYDESKIKSENVTIAISINGKTRVAKEFNEGIEEE